jgi:hypothetical protein
MKRSSILLAAGAIILAPAIALTPAIGAPPAPGSISPHHVTGQQVGDFVVGGGLECEDGVAPGSATRQHVAGDGSPFQEGSTSGDHYAGEQDGINNKNITSVSQYDLACFKGP